MSGAIAGVCLALLTHVMNALPTWFAFQGQTTMPLSFGGFEQIIITNPLEYLLAVHIPAVGIALVPISLYFVFRLVLRKPALAVTALLVVETLLNMGRENTRLELPVAFLTAAVIVWVVTRFGLFVVKNRSKICSHPQRAGPC